MAAAVPMPPVWQTGLRILFFRASREELQQLDRRHLVYGLAWTWIVGMGRWWDDPGAHPLQHLGLGSLIYVFALSGLLWLLIWPLRPQNWSYEGVLTFVALTSPPALIYAIPVEMLFDVETASLCNLWFLGIVALWRVSLLVFYLGRAGRLPIDDCLIGAVLPICLVIVTLTVLNLERAVFEIMGGLRAKTPKDDAYALLMMLTMLSVYGSIPILIWYVAAIGGAHKEHSASRKDGAAEPPEPEDPDAPEAESMGPRLVRDHFNVPPDEPE
jgi:hypothetical protein